jgi:hypothetical protein
VTALGAPSTVTVGGGVVGHPARSIALQVALLIIETAALLPGLPPVAGAPKFAT